jgi:hypothetical protein
VSRNIAGQSAEAVFDTILDGVPPSGAITWRVESSTAAPTQLEVSALGDFARPALVDRFESTDQGARFTTRVDSLRGRSQVRIPPVQPLVLAHYYPWYTKETWRDPRLTDQPLRLYSTDDLSDVGIVVRQAVSAGIDVFVSSWREWPLDAGDPSDRSMRVLLDAARPTPMKVCIYTESFTANPALDWSTAEPRTMERWLADIVDRCGTDPAYLRIDGQPVILVYAATLIDLEDWFDVIARLRASGRNLLLIGDFYESRLIEAFDGQYRLSDRVSGTIPQLGAPARFRRALVSSTRSTGASGPEDSSQPHEPGHGRRVAGAGSGWLSALVGSHGRSRWSGGHGRREAVAGSTPPSRRATAGQPARDAALVEISFRSLRAPAPRARRRDRPPSSAEYRFPIARRAQARGRRDRSHDSAVSRCPEAGLPASGLSAPDDRKH